MLYCVFLFSLELHFLLYKALALSTPKSPKGDLANNDMMLKSPLGDLGVRLLIPQSLHRISDGCFYYMP